METVIRVKRRYNDDPLDALLIACKKRKTEAGTFSDIAAESPQATVVKFAGTLENEEDDVVGHLHKTLTKDDLKAKYKQHAVNVANKARLKTQEESKESRYKVVNCNRSINNSKCDDEDEKIVTVIDVVDSACTDDKDPPSDKEIGFVYDLYYIQSEEEMYLDDGFWVQPFQEVLVSDNYDNGEPEVNHESDDSNSESNWRNDYPDEESSSNSSDEEGMVNAMGKVNLCGEHSDLSSDDEDLIYGVDQTDVELHGYRYAKWKARKMQEFAKDEEDSTESDCMADSESGDEN